MISELAVPFTGACTGKLRGGVRSQGFELEAFTRPMPDLAVNGGLVMADTKYRHDLVGADGRPLTNALFQLPGRRGSHCPSPWSVRPASTNAWQSRHFGCGPQPVSARRGHGLVAVHFGDAPEDDDTA